MIVETITPNDLEKFRLKLLEDIEQLLIDNDKVYLERWLRSTDVMAKLNISHAKLQNLRNSGKFPCTKVDGLIFYDEHEIDKVLKEGSLSLDIE